MENRRQCIECNQSILPIMNVGRRSLCCSAECKIKRRARQKKEIRWDYPICSLVDCSNRSLLRNGNLCGLHQARFERTGQTAKREGRISSKDKSGYVVLNNTSHPLASMSGRVYEHRATMYEVSSGVCPPCFWCNTKLSWKEAVVDHLNEVKHDNRIENLVCACSPCNMARGAILPFLRRITDDKFEVFLQLARTYNDSEDDIHGKT